MSTIERPDRQVLPPLVAGQRLDQPTFHERYAAMPSGTWAELIGGVVHIPSPLGGDHAETSEDIAGWLFLYRRATPGVRGTGNATTKLGNFGEPQPDSSLRIPEELGGQTLIVDGYLAGPPELVVEVARSSRTIDLGPKKADYERASVREYVVVELDPDRVHWFVRRDGRFVELAPGPDGLFRSEVFPGLWLDPSPLFAGDLNGLVAALERGLATPEHAEFVARPTAAGGLQV
jgi:Uma2 family endonuclease